jgi:hypothetical protein
VTAAAGKPKRLFQNQNSALLEYITAVLTSSSALPVLEEYINETRQQVT